jgi:general secretion pathway protein D
VTPDKAPGPPPGAPPPAATAAPAPAAEVAAAPVPDKPVLPPLPEGMLRLNFRNAPLESVLNYLSEAAGFIIVPQVPIRGTIDVWSNQPVTKSEALSVLKTALTKNGYGFTQNERTLTIVSRDTVKKLDIPVISGNNPQDIPKDEQVVTQIIPVRYISATQLIKDLQPLLPMETQLTANEGGNALVLTDTQTNIRRMAEIVRALDTAVSSVSRIRVFKLIYADAKSLATVIQNLFQVQDTSRNQGQGRFQNFFRGGGLPGMGGDQAASAGGGRAPTVRVIAVADERSNSLIVSAPEEQVPLIEEVVQSVDTNVEDVTELRVFKLRNADPQETADLLTELFPDTTSSQSGRGQVRFGGRGGPFGGGPFGAQASTTGQSQFQLKQTKVTAVPDLRTGSVIVSASRELMVQIGRMIEDLDNDAAKKQQVFVIPIENADPQTVEEILQGLFETQTSSNRRNTTRTTQQNSQLNNRSRSTQNQGSGTSGFGTSGFGGTSGTSGRTGR